MVQVNVLFYFIVFECARTDEWTKQKDTLNTLDAHFGMSNRIYSIDNSITTELKNRIRMRLMLWAIKRMPLWAGIYTPSVDQKQNQRRFTSPRYQHSFHHMRACACVYELEWVRLLSSLLFSLTLYVITLVCAQSNFFGTCLSGFSVPLFASLSVSSGARCSERSVHVFG